MLSATAVAQARPKRCQYKLWDERGLYLLVMPNGPLMAVQLPLGGQARNGLARCLS